MLSSGCTGLLRASRPHSQPRPVSEAGSQGPAPHRPRARSATALDLLRRLKPGGGARASPSRGGETAGSQLDERPLSQTEGGDRPRQPSATKGLSLGSKMRAAQQLLNNMWAYRGPSPCSPLDMAGGSHSRAEQSDGVTSPIFPSTPQSTHSRGMSPMSPFELRHGGEHASPGDQTSCTQPSAATAAAELSTWGVPGSPGGLPPPKPTNRQGPQLPRSQLAGGSATWTATPGGASHRVNAASPHSPEECLPPRPPELLRPRPPGGSRPSSASSSRPHPPAAREEGAWYEAPLPPSVEPPEMPEITRPRPPSRYKVRPPPIPAPPSSRSCQDDEAASRRSSDPRSGVHAEQYYSGRQVELPRRPATLPSSQVCPDASESHRRRWSHDGSAASEANEPSLTSSPRRASSLTSQPVPAVPPRATHVPSRSRSAGPASSRPSTAPPSSQLPRKDSLRTAFSLDLTKLSAMSMGAAEQEVLALLRSIAQGQDAAQRRHLVRELQRTVHPDKCPEEQQELATQLFQVLQRHREAALQGNVAF